MSDEKNLTIGEPTVKIAQSQLNSLLERLKKLEDINEGSKTVIAKHIGKHEGYVRYYEDKLVIDDVKNVREKWIRDENGDKVKKLTCSLTVLNDGKSEKVDEVNYLEFIKTGKKVSIILKSIEKKEISKVGGKVNVRQVEDFASKVVGETDDIITSEQIIYTIVFPDGKEMKIKAEALNI